MRAILWLTMLAIAVAIVAPPGCRRMRERVLLSLLRESERTVEFVGDDPPVFRFPPTAVRAIALIDYSGAERRDGHVSFVPPDGSERYAWAASVCGTWTSACLERAPAATVSEVTYGAPPPGLSQVEPSGGPPRPLQSNRLYGLALFGDKLFALKAFYRDDAGAFHVMDGVRFGEAVVQGRRGDIAAFLRP